jgi:peptidoglycan hydrolase-like protein with peptidoglycan-binding domain
MEALADGADIVVIEGFTEAAPSGDAAPAGERAPVGGGLGRRRRVVAGAAALAALVSMGGLGLATIVKSPADVAAEAKPPSPTVLTASVTRQVVRRTLVIRGSVSSSRIVRATPVPGNQGADTLVITAIRAQPGGAVRAGDVIVEVSGRPMLALPGPVPAYRDLKPGDSGPDVAQLQRALTAVGQPPSDPPGFFGAGTKSAIAALYRERGYDPPDTGGPGGRGDREALDGAHDAVVQAERHLADLRSGSGEGSGADRQRQIAYAIEDLATARRRYVDLVAHTGVMAPRSEIVYAPSFPARVVAVTGDVGDAVREPLVTLASGAPTVVARLDPADAALVRVGARVTIDSEVTGLHATGTVRVIGELTTPDAGTTAGEAPGSGVAQYVPATVVPATAISSSMIGQDVRLTVESASTKGAVLAVPQAAIASGADGSTFVTRRDADGSEERVSVRTGVTGNGFVEITPLSQDLHAGDAVVTGA